MNCPNCKNPITVSGNYCASCGYDFGDEEGKRLSFYFSLKEEFERVRSLQDELHEGLESIAVTFRSYEELLSRELGGGAASASTKEPAASPGAGHTDPPAAPAVPEPVARPASPSREMQSGTGRAGAQKTSEIEIHVGQKWLLIVGILTMVFGVGYFLKYSFEQGWISPALRVSMAYVWGAIFLASGDQFRKRGFRNFGLSLVGGGIAVLYFATFASFQLYVLLSQPLSFGIMILITVLASLLSVLYDTKWLAVLGLVGGFLTPVLLSTGQDNQIALMTYMTILNLGLLGIAFTKKWDLLNTLGFVFTYLLFTGWFVRHYAMSKFWPAILFLTVFFLIYSVAPFAYQLFRKSGEKLKGAVIMAPNAFIAFGFSYGMISERFTLSWVSVVTLFYAFVFLSMATYLYRHERHRQEAFILLLAQSSLFLIITVPILFSKHWITIFWAAQALTLLWIGIKLDRKSLAFGAYVLMAIAIYKFVLYDYPAIFHFNFSHRFAVRDSYTYLVVERLVTSIVMLIVLYVFGVQARTASLRVLSLARNDAAAIFSVLGIVLFIVLNIEVGSFFYDYLRSARFAAISVLWALFSMGLMALGFRKNNALVRTVSIGLFAVTVLKVFFFDMAKFSTPYRIVSFIILGIVLMGTSYLYYKFKDRILNVMAAEEKEETRL